MAEKDTSKKWYEVTEESTRVGQKYSSRKPWWLVIGLLLVLAAFGTYIWWINSPLSSTYSNMWTYMFGPQQTEIVSSASLADEVDNPVLGGDETTLDQALSDTLTNSWDELPSQTPEPASFPGQTPEIAPASVPETKPIQVPEAKPVPASSATGASGYYIKAGEFKTRQGALQRIRELRQGNYSARLMEKGEGQFVVAVGEFKNISAARSKSQEINFILEIKTSVEKNEYNP